MPLPAFRRIGKKTEKQALRLNAYYAHDFVLNRVEAIVQPGAPHGGIGLATGPAHIAYYFEVGMDDEHILILVRASGHDSLIHGGILVYTI
ncbi:unnamed protein product [Rhizoctonia solani]|uniref:Uncharacterized protein n=1 Tax=Rhizoctonia solani TaxID=456999 RepID=A0A8H2WH51_9AGAM|nr:unnamed protein product [Rhizoctonia solani]